MATTEPRILERFALGATEWTGSSGVRRCSWSHFGVDRYYHDLVALAKRDSGLTKSHTIEEAEARHGSKQKLRGAG